MAKLSAAVFAALVACASAFAPQKGAQSQTSLKAVTGFEEVGGKVFDPMGFLKLGSGVIDTFPNMFPNEQYLRESELKHGRQAMLAWTGIWATHQVSDFSLASFRNGSSVCFVLFSFSLTF